MEEHCYKGAMGKGWTAGWKTRPVSSAGYRELAWNSLEMRNLGTRTRTATLAARWGPLGRLSSSPRKFFDDVRRERERESPLLCRRKFRSGFSSTVSRILPIERRPIHFCQSFSCFDFTYASSSLPPPPPPRVRLRISVIL